MAAKILEGITQAKKSGGASGSGGEKKKEKGDLRQTVDLLSRLVLTHESELSVLTAASSWAVLIKDAALKKELEDLRQNYRDKGYNEGKHVGVPPLRTASHSVLVLRLSHALQAQTSEAATLAQQVVAMNAEEISTSILRLKPKYPKPPVDKEKPWVWILTFSQITTATALAKFWQMLSQTPTLNKADSIITVEPPNIGQGPLARELRQQVYGGASSSSKKRRTSPEP